MLKDVAKTVKANKTLMLVIGIVAIIIIVAVIWKIYQGFKKGTDVVGDSIGNNAIAAQTGIQLARVSFIRGLATDLWENGVDRKWAWRALRNYNEEKFIAAINSMVNIKEVALLDEFYKTKSAEKLWDVIDSAFSATDKAKVKTEFLGQLQK